jgi:DNA-binding response OmpR family regulator
MKRILVIDDEQMILDLVRTVIGSMGYHVDTTDDPIDGEQRAVNGAYDLVVVDLRMPDKSGAELTQTILEQRPETRVLVTTGYPEDPAAQRALDVGAQSLLHKPYDIEEIVGFAEA